MELNVLHDFKEKIARTDDGRYEVRLPWIPGADLSSTNEVFSRKRLQNKIIKSFKLQKKKKER